MQSKQKKLLVFPSSRSIREYVNSKKEFNTLLPQIITINELFTRSLFFENRKIIDEEERFLYLNEAIGEVNLNKLGLTSNFATFLKQSDYIYRFFLELASEDVLIEDIDLNDTYGFYKEHLDILKQIYKNYLEILDKNLSIDKINSNQYFKLNEEFIKNYDSIEIYFEGYFTSFEFNVIEKIAKKTKLIISFDYNQYNQKSISKFENLDLEFEKNNRYKIDFSNKNIISKVPLENKNRYLEVKAFSSRINQISYIKKSITNIVDSGIDPSNIVLVLPDESFVSTIQLFDNEKYFNYAMGLNIYTTKLFKTVDSIYLYMNEDEIKNFKNLEFEELDLEQIEKIFKRNWKKNLTELIFDEVVTFLLSKENNEELIEKFKELIYKFKKLIFSANEKLLLKDAYKILHQKVMKLSLDDINSGKITVMGLLESRLINFDALIICDFNESLIPKRSVKDKFLSTSIKEKVNLPTANDRENLQKYYYERLIRNSKNVYISYVKNESEQISRFATSLFEEKIEEKVYDNEYKHILYNSQTLKYIDEEIIKDIDLSTIVWSASSLKEFLECKRKYYLNHILKIKEHDISLKPKGYELGNFVHNSLEEYYKQDMKGYDTLLNIFNKNRTNNPFLNLDLEVWKKRLKEFVKIEEKRFEEGFSIVDLEKPFFFEYEGIKLRGTIDRIDKNSNNEFYVIDYKTSSNLKIDTKRTFEKAVDFQLEFYFLAVQNIYNTSAANTFYYDLYEMRLKEEALLDEKLEILRKIFSEFKTKEVNFEKCENSSICTYCQYKTICNRA